MKIINSQIHGVIDYVVVAFLIAAPSIFMLSIPVATITYGLAIVHLILTLLTRFKAGMVKVIPFKVHGIIELLVSILLVALPWLISFSGNVTDRNFYVSFGIAVFITWLLTDYDTESTPS